MSDSKNKSVSPIEDSIIFDIIRASMKVPGVKIDRSNYLKKELSKRYNLDIVNEAISLNPAIAGIDIKVINKIAKAAINFETNKVSSISALAGLPGGLAMIGSVPADVTQYFAHVIIILQKLIYLYGWGELFNSEDELDDATMNQLIIFIGVMFGVNTANVTINKIAKLAAIRTEKVLVNKALTKGTIYPVVKKIATVLGVKMTKQIFAKGVSKVVPLLGVVLSGGLSYLTFKPMAKSLKAHLEILPTASVEYYKEEHEIIDVDFKEINSL
jgi:hypothetical protein